MRIGVVGYHNSLPLHHGLKDQLPEAELVYENPSRVAEMLNAEELDVGLVPVASVATHPDWGVVPGLGIACRGAVRSVLLLSDKPQTEIHTLVTDPASKTSNVLAKIWLEAQQPFSIEVKSGSRQWRDRLKAGDATLLIGDEALFLEDPPATVIDLGQAWWDWTALPFVFAVWAGPKASDEALIQGLHRVYEKNQDKLSELAHLAEPKDATRREKVETYLAQSIRYQLGESEEAGLRCYFERGHHVLDVTPRGAHHVSVI
ncbi:MAG: menaquinone biosynthesis protein [Candidatus Eisenbacteria bacterium]|uniref:Chorismate dehydratase n=1 Tax=Eiseniibacteriota bacterium TaxID=2212470 RepID=A0A7Y2EEK7_UNCEI|nr:menaquinone biosynthesis protein [Candidatus Eisenbacteria bacterium]